MLYWSRDAGATWAALPTMAGVEGGFVDPLAIGALLIASDGTIIAGPLHRYGPNLIMPAGYFSLRATDPAPVWRPLAPPVAANPPVLQAVATPTGVRLWAIEYDAPLGPHLVYVDVP
jgi:hypothetical protein